MQTKTMCLLAVLVFGSACTIGQNAEEWGVARSVAGANTTVVTTKGTVRGELLEVRSDGVVLLRSDRQLVFAPFTAISGMEAVGLGGDFLVNGAAPMNADKKVRFAMVSHFPQGMPTAARDQLLAAAGQKEITVIE